jgi:hypothetical protein
MNIVTVSESFETTHFRAAIEKNFLRLHEANFRSTSRVSEQSVVTMTDGALWKQPVPDKIHVSIFSVYR